MNISAESDEQAVEEPKLEDESAEEATAVAEPAPIDSEAEALAAEAASEPRLEPETESEEADETAVMEAGALVEALVESAPEPAPESAVIAEDADEAIVVAEIEDEEPSDADGSFEDELDQDDSDEVVSVAEEAPVDEGKPPEPPEEEVADLPATRLKYVAFEEDDLDGEARETLPPSPPKKQQRQISRTPRKNQPTLRQVTDRFAACGRCSYFWAGYRVLFGLEELETAVAESKSGWLELIWNEQMPELIHKSYGVRFDIAYFHYDACCDECRRHFIYQETEKEDEAAAFRIEISPRMAK